MNNKYQDKKILILGDNPESGVLVETANNLGTKTIVVGINKNTKPKNIAWKAVDVNALDIVALEKIAKEEKIDGISIGVADILVPAYTEICDRTNLPCYSSYDAVKYLSNKSIFKEQLKKVGLPVIPEYQNMDDYDKIPLPVFVKPVDSGGGMGISIVTKRDQLKPAIEYATNSSHTKTIQIEKYMQGDIVACYYTIIDGKVYLSSLEDNLFTKKQEDLCPVTTGHIYSSKYIDLYFEKYHDKICKLLENVNAKNGILQINAFIENNEFYFYDPGYRLQGEAQHHILKNVNKFDHKEMLINFAFSGKMYDGDFEKLNDPYLHGKKCASVWVLLKKGKIKNIKGLEDLLNDDRVIFNGQRFFEGDIVEERFIGTEKQVFSRIYVVCDDKKALIDIVNKINEKLIIISEENENMILDVLSPKNIEDYCL